MLNTDADRFIFSFQKVWPNAEVAVILGQWQRLDKDYEQRMNEEKKVKFEAQSGHFSSLSVFVFCSRLLAFVPFHFESCGRPIARERESKDECFCSIGIFPIFWNKIHCQFESPHERISFVANMRHTDDMHAEGLRRGKCEREKKNLTDLWVKDVHNRTYGSVVSE